MRQTGMEPRSTPNRDVPQFDDEMPVMVDSEGNILSDYPEAKEPKCNLDEEADIEFIEESIKEFEHEAVHPSEITQQPTSKRKKMSPVSPLAVRTSPKVAVQNRTLLSFSMEDEEES